MLKIAIKVPGASFEFEGDVPLAEARPLLDLWFDALTDPKGKLRELTAQLRESNTDLLNAERADAGNP